MQMRERIGRNLACHMLLILALAIWVNGDICLAEIHDTETGAFIVEHELTLPGSPAEIYDAVTGDISGWWDHTVSSDPIKLIIEAKPGGGFWEIFDESGDGVRHAVVTGAQRGKFLRFEGPLGLAGNALHMVTTYTFEPASDDSTHLKLSVHGQGELQAGWSEAVDRTWRHFLFERFQPFVVGERASQGDRH